jgi:hypothetical protein
MATYGDPGTLLPKAEFNVILRWVQKRYAGLPAGCAFSPSSLDSTTETLDCPTSSGKNGVTLLSEEVILPEADAANKNQNRSIINSE